MESAERTLTLLVVDDEPINIRRVVECLGDAYRILTAGSGKRALEVVKQTRPDLVLLDVSMPEMNGYEVCQRLQADPRMKEVPVIFVTGMSGQDNEFQGLKHGAVDYITKPFREEILQARVETHLALEQARERLREINRELEEQVLERTRELHEAHERLKALDRAKEEFLNAISHELRTPVNGVLGLAHVAFIEFARRKKDPELEHAFYQSRDRLIRMIESAEFLVNLQFEKDPRGHEVVEVSELMASALQAAQEAYGSGKLEVESSIEREIVWGSERLMRFALVPLIGAGLKFSTKEVPLRVFGRREGQVYLIDLTFVSHPIGENVLECFFELGSVHRSSSRVEELGLSISVAYEAICLMGGTARIYPLEEEDGVYRISLNLERAEGENADGETTAHPSVKDADDRSG